MRKVTACSHELRAARGLSSEDIRSTQHETRNTFEIGSANVQYSQTIAARSRVGIRDHSSRSAGRGDVVLVLGKGHEQGQEFADRTEPFDDKTVVAEQWQELQGRVS